MCTPLSGKGHIYTVTVEPGYVSAGSVYVLSRNKIKKEFYAAT